MVCRWPPPPWWAEKNQSFFFLNSFVFFLERVSFCSPSWSGTQLAQAGLKIAISLVSQPSECWGHRHEPPHLARTAFEIVKSLACALGRLQSPPQQQLGTVTVERISGTLHSGMHTVKLWNYAAPSLLQDRGEERSYFPVKSVSCAKVEAVRTEKVELHLFPFISAAYTHREKHTQAI